MKALVLVSGGVDSTTCLGLAVKEFGSEQVTALAISYGQKHQKEIESARAVCSYYNVDLAEIDLAPMFQYSNCSLLIHSDEDIPEQSYEKQIQESHGAPVSTYVPFRNGLFLSAAASIALSLGCEIIYYGAHGDDAAGNAYPDCSEVFNRAMNTAIYEGSGKQVRIEAPFVNLSKTDVVKAGMGIQIPYHLTWSCYEGTDMPCGVCATCIDRNKAFEQNGLKDPLLQEENYDRKK